MATGQTQSNSEDERDGDYLEEIGRSILLLATLVATATYAAGFSPPGGVWQETAGHLPGDPIMRSTHYVRYLMFFYCNATAFASSFMVVVLIIFLMVARRRRRQEYLRIIVIPMVLVMLLGLLSLIGAYATGTFRDVFTAVFTSLLVAAVFTYVAVERVLAYFRVEGSPIVFVGRDGVVMQLATFALTATYSSGLSTPGGFWDTTDGGNRPGDAIRKGARPAAFFVCNTMAFVASLLVILVLLLRKIRLMAVSAGSVVVLFGFLGAYLAGSCLETGTTIYLAILIGAIVGYVVFHVCCHWKAQSNTPRPATQLRVTNFRARARAVATLPPQHQISEKRREEREKEAHSTYVEYLTTLALTITYVAGLHPPGGVWQDDDDGDVHKAGDPILQTTHLRRYNAFFYCNSVAFVASLLCMILVRLKSILKLKHRALEQAMILEMLALVGSYAFGSCRTETTTVYTMGIGGAALVYVVLHVVLLDNDRERKDKNLSLDRLGYGFFVFAIFVASITYQAGLTPPGGFLLKDDESGNHAGDPVLLHNYPRRYRVFFYCNSTSFMVSIAVIILLVNKKLYRPAIQTHALSICTAVSFFCLLAAFAAGTTQHLRTSIYILVLLGCGLFCSAILLILLFVLRSSISWPWKPKNTADDANPTIPTSSEGRNAADDANPTIPTSSEGRNAQAEDPATPNPSIGPPPTNVLSDEDYYEVQDKRVHAFRMYLMTVGVLVASVTYQAGLDPPGGSWQASADGHHAGDPVMQSNRRQRYLTFFYSNSASFVASIFLMVLVLTSTRTYYIRVIRLYSYIRSTTLMLGFMGLFGGYASGSNREWKTSVTIVVIFISVHAYFSLLLFLPLFTQKDGDYSGAEESE